MRDQQPAGGVVYSYVQRPSSRRFPYGALGPFMSHAEASNALEVLQAQEPDSCFTIEHGTLNIEQAGMLVGDCALAKSQLVALQSIRQARLSAPIT